MGITTIRDETDLFGLIELVKNSQRSKPVCIVSTPVSTAEPAFDIETLEKQTGDIAFLYVVPTGDFTRTFVNELGPKAAVFNGAAKVFSADWQELEEWPRIHYCQESFKTRDTESLISQVWRCADQNDLLKFAQLNTVAATGTVEAFFDSRAIVKIGDSMLTTIRQELVAANVPLEWMFDKGQQVKGKLNEAERLFIPSLLERSLENIVTEYGFDNLVLVLIKHAERKKGIATIYPGIDVEFTLSEISGNDLDLVTDFLEVGQVVAMRIYRDPQGRTRLKMSDIDDDEVPVNAVSVLNGGKPWLIPERDIPIEEELTPPQQLELEVPDFVEPVAVEEAKTAPIPHPGNYTSNSNGKSETLSLHDQNQWKSFTKGLQNTITKLREEISSLKSELAASWGEKEKLRRSLTEQQRSSASARRRTAVNDPNRSNTRSRRTRWAFDSDWFNEELRRVWISRYTPQEREENYPLIFSKFSYGDSFFESVKDSSLTEDELRKSVRCIVDIVTGREADSRQNRVHALRESEASSSKPRVRADGATAWRANIEDKTAQARRLHFWKLPDGHIELAKIVKHDDASI